MLRALHLMYLIFFPLLDEKNSNLKGTPALLYSCARYNSCVNECYRTYAGPYLHAAVMAHSRPSSRVHYFSLSSCGARQARSALIQDIYMWQKASYYRESARRLTTLIKSHDT